jgi:hypothetical protein
MFSAPTRHTAFLADWLFASLDGVDAQSLIRGNFAITCPPLFEELATFF